MYNTNLNLTDDTLITLGQSRICINYSIVKFVLLITEKEKDIKYVFDVVCEMKII